MSMNRIGAAVVGVGIYGEVHVRTYAKEPQVNLVSVWSRTKRHAQEISRKYDCAYTTSLDEVASDPRVKIVSIATPDFAHTEAAIKMLQAGKHVLIEKPMATSVEECERILLAQRESGSKMMVNFHNRWHPPIAEAKIRVEKGEIGTPVTIYAKLSDRIEVATEWLSWAGKSGPEWFLLPHTVDLTRWLIGRQRAKRVFALGKRGILANRGIDCYDAVQAQVEFEKTIATFESSWILPPSWPNVIEFKIDILGSEGKIGITGDREGIEVAAEKYHTPFVLDPITEEEPIRYFLDCVLKDKSPGASGEDGLAVTKIIEAVVISLQQGTVAEVVD